MYTCVFNVLSFHSFFDRISAACFADYMTACAEKHVLHALEIEKQQQKARVTDLVEAALATLQAVEYCPGPNCGIPFEHDGECNFFESVHSDTHCRCLCGHVLPRLSLPFLFVL